MSQNDLINKVNRVIETSHFEHKAIVERFICLASRQMGKEDEKIGIDEAIRQKFIEKYGDFTLQQEPVSLSR